jgi:NAD(P)H-dependent FMN reductase
MNIAVIYGSVRSGRQGIKAANFIVNKLTERIHEVNLIDPKEFQLPLLDKMYKEYEKGKAPAVLEKLASILKEADGYVIVSAEYNHSIPPALSNLIDHFMEEYFFKPSAIVGYSAGSFGGTRVAMQLRALLPEVGMSSIPSVFNISKVQDAFDDSGKDLTGENDKRVGKFLDEFEWYINALSEARKKGLPY